MQRWTHKVRDRWGALRHEGQGRGKATREGRMGQEELCAERRRRLEVSRKGAKGVEAAGAARARAGSGEAIQ